MNFSALNLPALPVLENSSVVKLSESFGQNQDSLPAGVPQATQNQPRRVEEIIANLEENQTDKISYLEWIYLLYHKESYDQSNPENRIKTSQLIWDFAKTNNWLKRRLLWNLALFYGKAQNNVMAASLVETFPPNFIGKSNPVEIATAAILQALQQTDNVAEELARLSFNYKNSPKTLLHSHQLPNWIPQTQEALNFVAQFFPNSPTPQQENWFLTCLSQMSTEQQVKATEYLLKNIAVEKAATLSNLMAWLKQKFGSRITSSPWQQLPDEAQITLRKWIGAAHYRDFETFVDLLLRQKIIEQLDIPITEQQQLRSRKAFWANYSDRFEQIRILLPQKSIKVLGNNIPQNVEILKEDGSNTEVCIFDFGDWFIVEFFRGGGSETRLFNRAENTEFEQKLFYSSEISVKCLRTLKPCEIHDHVFCWQSDCEKWLRAKNILPNEGTVVFKGMSNQQGKYGLDGLPTPLPHDQKKRNSQLEEWKNQITKIESEAQKYAKIQN